MISMKPYKIKESNNEKCNNVFGWDFCRNFCENPNVKMGKPGGGGHSVVKS
jgi:hypothetical protein